MNDANSVVDGPDIGRQTDLVEWIAENVQKRTCAENDPDRLRRTDLSRGDWQELTTAIAGRVETFSSAYKPLRPSRDADTGGRIFPPDVRNSGFYPSTGIAKAAKWADRAASVGEVENVRFLTLRPIIPPDPGELEVHLRHASKFMGEHASYLQKRGLAQVWLNVVNIRIDPRTGRFDPHVHCVWEIRAEHLDVVRGYLGSRYVVWIDGQSVRDIRKTVFYACSGIFDYQEMPSWPLERFKEAHAISGLKLIRASGPLKMARMRSHSLLCAPCAQTAGLKRQLRRMSSKPAVVKRKLPSGHRSTEILDPCRCGRCGTRFKAEDDSGIEIVATSLGAEQGEKASMMPISEVVVIAGTSTPDGMKAPPSGLGLSDAAQPREIRRQVKANSERRNSGSRVRRRKGIREEEATGMCDSFRVTVRPVVQDSVPHEPRLSTVAQVVSILRDRLAHRSENAEATFGRLWIDELQALKSLRDVEVFFGTMLVDVEKGWALTRDGLRFLEISADATDAATTALRAFEHSLPPNPRAAVWTTPDRQ